MASRAGYRAVLDAKLIIDRHLQSFADRKADSAPGKIGVDVPAVSCRVIKQPAALFSPKQPGGCVVRCDRQAVYTVIRCVCRDIPGYDNMLALHRSQVITCLLQSVAVCVNGHQLPILGCAVGGIYSSPGCRCGLYAVRQPLITGCCRHLFNLIIVRLTHI